MENIRNFSEFLNESNNLNEAKTTLEKLSNSVITQKDYERRDLQYYRDRFENELESIGINNTMKMTLAKLTKHPNYENLDDEYKDIINAKVGAGGRTPNAKFVKAFAQAFKKFPDRDSFSPDRDERLALAIDIKEQIEDNIYPCTYDGLDNQERKKLAKDYMWASKIKDTVTEKEFKFLQKLVKRKYENFIAKEFEDKNVEGVIKWKIEKAINPDRYSNEAKVMGLNWSVKMPDFYKFIKDSYLNNQLSYSDWDTFEVVKYNQVRSDHGPVTSSSFSTYYYFDIEVKFKGKKFKYEDVRGGSTYYSGGWN